MEAPIEISVNPLSSSIISPIPIVQGQLYLPIITTASYPHEYNSYFIYLLVHILSFYGYQTVVIAISTVAITNPG